MGTEQTSDKCLLGSRLEKERGFPVAGMKAPFWGCLTPGCEDLI